MGKQSGNRLFFIFLLLSCLTSTISAAATVSFVKEYTYQASEIDSKISSRAIALEQVKRLLLEELGTYLETQTEVKNYQLTKDQITMLTAGIVSAEVLQEKWDGSTYYLKAKIAADPGEVAKAVNAARDNRRTSLALEESRARAGEASKEIARLKKELESLRTDSIKQKEYISAVKELGAADWFDRGQAFFLEEKYIEAVAAFNRAIELDPGFSDAYLSRGSAYYGLENKIKGARDVEEGIRLLKKEVNADPKNVNALIRLGNALFDSERCDEAVGVYGKALQADPGNLDVRIDMATCYRGIGMPDKTTAELRTVLSINPKNTIARYNLGVVLLHDMGAAEEAIKEWEVYLKLDPNGNAAESVRNWIKEIKSKKQKKP